MEKWLHTVPVDTAVACGSPENGSLYYSVPWHRLRPLSAGSVTLPTLAIASLCVWGAGLWLNNKQHIW